MPPKGSPKKKKGKKKSNEPLVARPEPMDCDEVEAAYLWDRVGPIQANPLGPAPQLYTYATSQVINPGPPSSVVLGLASASVPLLSPQPPSSPPSSPAVTTARPKQTESSAVPSAGPFTARGGSSGGTEPQPQSAGSSGVPVPSSHPPVVGTSTANLQTIMKTQGAFFAPQPPLRSVTVEKERGVMKVTKAELGWQDSQAKRDEKVDHYTDVSASIAHDQATLSGKIKELNSKNSDADEKLRNDDAQHQHSLDEQKQQFAIHRFRLDEDLTQLNSKRDRVLSDLADKKETLEEISLRESELRSLKQNHKLVLEEEEHRLADEVRRLKETMVQRLRRTMEEMERLTQQHRDKRQQRAVSESARLVTKLSVLEQKSKHLASVNTKLTAKAESARRDQQLEADRHNLLAQKSQTLAKEIRDLSSSLQGYEKMFAEKSISAAQSEEVLSLSKAIDQQYQTILDLKRETDEVKAKAVEAQKKFEALQQRQYLQQRLMANSLQGTSLSPSLGGSKSQHEPQQQQKLLTSGSGSASNMALSNLQLSTGSEEEEEPPHVREQVRALLIRSVLDIDKTMKEMSEGTKSIRSVSDRREKLELLRYIMNRVANFRSGVFPSTPTKSLLQSRSVQELVETARHNYPVPPPPVAISSTPTKMVGSSGTSGSRVGSSRQESSQPTGEGVVLPPIAAVGTGMAEDP